MANQEHLRIAKLGVGAWNEWRLADRHRTRPDLSFGDFERARLWKMDLRSANLEGANFHAADLKEAQMEKAVLTSADFGDSILDKANLTFVEAEGTSFRRASLSLTKASNASLRGAQFDWALLDETDFYYADLREARFYNATLINVELVEANNLRGAKLGGATLSKLYVDGANFSGAKLGWTIISDTDLSEAKGLDEIIHDNPVSVGIDTIYESDGKIPEVFLRKAGVPENFITYMHSLTGTALEFYKCFISYTEADDALSERLYNDLQARGVRCWRWREDAPWGRSLMKSVRVYDKLVVICSERSLNAPAVIREIERALQKEDDLASRGKDSEVLFPIRLDNYIFDGWEHHRKGRYDH